MDLKGIKWTRVDPNTHIKYRYKIAQILFDGDSQLDNDFRQRNHWTVEETMHVYNNYMSTIDTEETYKNNLEKFKEQCANGEVSINLSTVSDKLFFSSEAMDDFWRVAFTIHRGYEAR